MTGWLIYEKENIARNQKFIDFFLSAAQKRGIQLLLLSVCEIAAGNLDGKPFVMPDKPQFAVMRCMNPLLSMQLEACGIRVFNSSVVSEYCNDKRRTSLFFAQHSLPCLDTAFVSARCSLHPFEYPVVLKAARGCGGRQVYLCETKDKYLETLEKIAPDDGVVQPLCDTPGRDVRLYMLGETCVQAMERYSDTDFRSNFGLHGNARPFDATPEMLSAAREIALSLHSDLIGVDFIFHGGKIYLNEVEDAVGTRMLYQYTKLQIVEMYMDRIVEQLA